MNQDQFDQLLSWTMLGSLNSAVLEQQIILGRDLTAEEYSECHKKAHQSAELIQSQLRQARENFGT